MDMTTFYFPGLTSSLKMTSDEFDSSPSDEDENPGEEEKIQEDILVGFVSNENNDIHYETVLQHIDFNWEFEALDSELIYENDNEIAKIIWKNRSPMFHVRREPIPEEIKAEIVLNCLYKNQSKDKEAMKHGITLQMINNAIYEFQIIKRVSKRTRKSVNIKRNKITRRHVKSLQKFTEEHSETGFTLESARHHLLQNFPDINDISLSTWSLLMRDKLKLSYKKLGNTNPSKLIPDNRANLVSWLKAIIGLKERGFYLIFIDEFLVNRNTINNYGWTQRGMPGRLFRRPTGFKMSFVVAHSISRVEGIMGTKTTFNQDKYTKFLNRLTIKVKRSQDDNTNKIVVVADNWRFHKTEKVKKFFEKERMMWLFIPPYSPEINPCEKLINFVKNCIKGQVSLQK